MNSILIVAYLAVQSGNTYHVVALYRDGTFITRSPITYGYGEQYLYTAMQLALRIPYFEKLFHPIMADLQGPISITTALALRGIPSNVQVNHLPSYRELKVMELMS